MKALKIVEPKQSKGQTLFNKDTGFQYVPDKTPITWNDAINAMSAEEKAEFFSEWIGCDGCPNPIDCNGECTKMLTKLFNSPYNGAQKGAE